MRSKYGLTLEEALILIAVTECNLSHRPGTSALTHASVLSIAQFLNLPYESTRRRMSRLADRQLLKRMGYDGYVIVNLALVRDLIDLLDLDALNATHDPSAHHTTSADE